jgi:replicative DNA helicase
MNTQAIPRDDNARGRPGLRLLEGESRTLPHSLEAEESLLAGCLMDDGVTVARALRGGIRPASFYDPKHGLLFDRLAEMTARSLPVSTATLAEELKEARQLEAAGGIAFIVQVSQAQPITLTIGQLRRLANE